ncbi:MAG: aspartate aminotransferase family protein [Solirubrobacterales bacterium]
MSTVEVATGGAGLLPRQSTFRYPIVESADGVWLKLADGRRILDACSGGSMTSCLGHGNDAAIAAAAEQGALLSYSYSHHFTNEPQELLARELIERAAPSMARVRFASGGSEANETALRLIRSYHVERGDEDRLRVISPAQAYHGSLTGTLALSGRPSLRQGWDPYLAEQPHLSPVVFREDPSGAAALALLDELLEECGPGNVAAYFCEPISAAAMPAFSPPVGFWEGLAERRERHGFLICCDEIVTGMGRTGTWFASDRLPFQPDIVTTGKGLGAGYAPLSAVLCTEGVYAALDNGSGDFDHGHTWDGAPLPCAVGRAVLAELVDRDLVGRVDREGPGLLDRLSDRIGSLEMVREVRGAGFLLGAELVDPRDGASPLPPDLDLERLVVEQGLEAEVLLAATSTSADGLVGDQLVLAPAFTAEIDELALMVDRAGEALAAVESSILAGPGAGT